MSRPTPARRGSAYVLVLAVVAIAAVAGVLNIHLRDRQLHLAADLHDYAQARDAARAGIELALARLDADPDWRTTRASGSTVVTMSDAGLSVTVTIVDPDDADLNSGRIRLASTATMPGARQRLTLDLEPFDAPANSLDASLAAAGAITLTSTTLTGDRPARAATLSAVSSDIAVAALASDDILGGTYHAGSTAGAPEPQMPHSNLVQSFTGKATSAVNNNPGSLERFILAPRHNSMSLFRTNASGIYAINCQNRALTLRDFRVRGTLILYNNSQGVRIEGQVRMDPESPSMPALLSDGPLEIRIPSPVASEDDANLNFNPLAAPFNSTSDLDQNDEYPSGIFGLIYAAGSIEITGTLNGAGPVISASSLSAESATIDRADIPALRATPLRQFVIEDAALRIDPFSIRN